VRKARKTLGILGNGMFDLGENSSIASAADVPAMRAAALPEGSLVDGVFE